jgi:exonuclease VII large subunit
MTVLKKQGIVVRSASQLKVGDRLLTRFADGQIESVVADARQLSLFE